MNKKIVSILRSCFWLLGPIQHYLSTGASKSLVNGSCSSSSSVSLITSLESCTSISTSFSSTVFSGVISWLSLLIYLLDSPCSCKVLSCNSRFALLTLKERLIVVTRRLIERLIERRMVDTVLISSRNERCGCSLSNTGFVLFVCTVQQYKNVTKQTINAMMPRVTPAQ